MAGCKIIQMNNLPSGPWLCFQWCPEDQGCQQNQKKSLVQSQVCKSGLLYQILISKLFLRSPPGFVGMALLQYLVHLLPCKFWKDGVQLVNALWNCRKSLLFHPNEVEFENSNREKLGNVFCLHLLLFEVCQERAEELNLWIFSEVSLEVGCFIGLEVFSRLVKVVQVVWTHVKRLLQCVRYFSDLILRCQVVFQDVLD